MITLGERPSMALAARGRDLLAALGEGGGLGEAVPAGHGLLVHFDPARTSALEICSRLLQLESRLTNRRPSEPRTIAIPVCYGGEHGPDLQRLASEKGMEVADLIRLHSQPTYGVLQLGFLPGFPYLDGLPPALATPRLQTPRTSIPAGSVAIGGDQTGIYPLSSPGGWHLVGRTPLRLFDPTSAAPFLFSAGDGVRFEPVDAAAFERIAAEQAAKRERRVAARGPGEGADPDASPLFEVVKPGPLTTIQDQGRRGYLAWGLPAAGALDPYSYQAGNALLGNTPGDASLEITLPGLRLRAVRRGLVAATGADLGATLDGAALPMWEAVAVPAGGEIAFARIGSGCRAYLAVAGGIRVTPVLGSRSTYVPASLGGLHGRALRAGDMLPAGPVPPGREAGRRLAPGLRPEWSEAPVVRLLPGRQWDRFGGESRSALLGEPYTVTPRSNRMGYRLQGRQLPAAGHDIPPEPLVEGDVQVPGDGQPIVLLADRQTTGGYAKIGTVIGADMPAVAQLRPGQRIRFRLVDLEAARAAWIEMQGRLAAVARRPGDPARKEDAP